MNGGRMAVVEIDVGKAALSLSFSRSSRLFLFPFLGNNPA